MRIELIQSALRAGMYYQSQLLMTLIVRCFLQLPLCVGVFEPSAHIPKHIVVVIISRFISLGPLIV